jgi:GNAT superfamily N-acetyltransferase
MKRLFVRPAFRGEGVGRAAAQTILEGPAESGISVCDWTRCRPQEPLQSLGFREIPPYQHVPIEGVIFMELEL